MCFLQNLTFSPRSVPVGGSLPPLVRCSVVSSFHPFHSVSGTPLAVAGKEDSEIHHTIAELMILANSAVAEKIQGAFPSAALVRVHASPDPSRLTAFEGVAAKVGVRVGVGADPKRKGGTTVGAGVKAGRGGGGGAAEGERGGGWWGREWMHE